MENTEIDIDMDITPPSLDNSSRTEMMWTERPEKQLATWKKEIDLKSKHHNKVGKKNKKLYIITGIPSIIIPLIIAGLNGVVDIMPITISILMICSSVISTISSFINFGKKSQVHLEYDSKYDELSLIIELELCKKKIDRIACDVFLERIFNRYNALNSAAPT
jgi:hypothetical protein